MVTENPRILPIHQELDEIAQHNKQHFSKPKHGWWEPIGEDGAPIAVEKPERKKLPLLKVLKERLANEVKSQHNLYVQETIGHHYMICRGTQMVFQEFLELLAMIAKVCFPREGAQQAARRVLE